MGLEQARFNMIEQQIRPWDVLDQTVLDTIAQVPREAFIAARYQKLAYADTAVPLSHDQVMMHPIIEARMLQALQIQPTDNVLEIGTGSGYVTALLARLAHHVYSVDLYEDFTSQAGQTLDKLGIHNVTLETGDAAEGWDRHALYDAIAITGSLPELPENFKHSMNRGGRLFAVTGQAPVMEAVLIRRTGEHEWTREILFETDLPILVNARQPSTFVF